MQDPNADPTEVEFVELDPHHGNLWPVEVDLTRRPDPIPETARGHPGKPRYGYPLCWSRTNFEWYPYLPAVSSFHYPIFRGMQSARIVSTGSGWKLRDEDIFLWASVEFVLLKTIQILGAGRLTSLEHVTPHWPESFGYKRLHSTEKFASKAKIASLNAFQRMLAYCSYTISEASIPKLLAVPYEYRTFLNNPHWIEYLFREVAQDVPNSDVHVLLKFLFATIGELRQTNNSIGIVVSYHKEYHYPSVLAMSRSGIPIYVRWHETLKLNSYSTYHQHHMLKEWAPNLDDFKLLERPPLDQLAVSDVDGLQASEPSVPPPPPNSSHTFLDPMDYVRRRTADITTKLAESDRAQSMKDRQTSAMKFGTRSYRGADVYELERTERTDSHTGQKIVYWERRRLNRDDAYRTYDLASPSQLWYVLLLFSYFISLIAIQV
jgi:hypothetical protein